VSAVTVIEVGRFAKILARADAATKGPWKWSEKRLSSVVESSEFVISDSSYAPDAEFIAHAREDVPFLLAALAAAEAALRGVANAYGCYAGCTAALPGGEGRTHRPACRAARAALASVRGDGE
jgi:hypothetical protein